MEKIDFERLLDPYREGGRTIGGQIEWLTRKHAMPQHCVDMAMIDVYRSHLSEVTDGNSLDQLLLKVTQDIYRKELADQMLRRISDLSRKIDGEWANLTMWQKIVAVLKGEA